jgi:hypothetical protein
MSQPEAVAALAPVLAVLQRLGVRHYVGGSMASSAHGIARSSVDADVVAELRPEHVSPLVAELADAYYVPEARVQDAVLRRGSFNLIHHQTMFKVDVFVARDRPFDRRALERARAAPEETMGGVRVPLASAEDTILAKLEWYRRGGEVSQRQWSDVIGMLQVGGTSLDGAYLAQGARELGVADLLARALEGNSAS